VSTNNYFQVLPEAIKQALGKAAFDAYLHHPPPFEFIVQWDDLKPEIQARWYAIVETIMNQLQDRNEFVTTELMEYNERARVLADAVERFETWKPDDDIFQNNYQKLTHLISLHGEVVNAQLLISRKDIEQGNFQVKGESDTAKVFIPNVRMSE